MHLLQVVYVILTMCVYYRLYASVTGCIRNCTAAVRPADRVPREGGYTAGLTGRRYILHQARLFQT